VKALVNFFVLWIVLAIVVITWPIIFVVVAIQAHKDSDFSPQIARLYFWDKDI